MSKKQNDSTGLHQYFLSIDFEIISFVEFNSSFFEFTKVAIQNIPCTNDIKYIDYIESFIDQIKKYITQDSIVNIAFDSKSFSIIPEEIIKNKKNNLNHIFYLLNPKNQQESIYLDCVNTNINIAYSVQNNLLKLIEQKFNYVTFHSLKKGLLKYFFNLNFNQEIIYIYLNTNNVDFFIFKDNQLQLVNSLSYTSIYDVIYFTINFCKKINFDMSSVIVQILGINHTINMSVYSLIKEFIPNVKYFNFTKKIKIPNTIKEQDQILKIYLFCLCE